MTDPVDLVAKRRMSWPQRIGAFVLMVLIGAGVAGLVVGLSAKDEAGEATKSVERAGPPCVDVAPGPAVKPSRGCEDVYRLLVEKCARDPAFCRRSNREAVKAAQERSAEDEIGPLAQVPEGGGRSEGNRPRSPITPSPRGGGGGGPEPRPDRPGPSEPGTPRPNDPPNPPADPPVNPPPNNPPPKPDPEVEAPGPVVDVPEVFEPVCRLIDPLVGPIIRICE